MNKRIKKKKFKQKLELIKLWTSTMAQICEPNVIYQFEDLKLSFEISDGNVITTIHEYK